MVSVIRHFASTLQLSIFNDINGERERKRSPRQVIFNQGIGKERSQIFIEAATINLKFVHIYRKLKLIYLLSFPVPYSVIRCDSAPGLRRVVTVVPLIRFRRRPFEGET